MIETEEQAQEKFLEALAQTDFAVLYYGLYETFRSRKDVTDKADVDVKQIVRELSKPITYDKRESVYVYREEKADFRFVAKAFMVEFIFTYDVPQGIVGGPFTLLAYDSALLKDPTFTYSPRAPKIPFANAKDLREILKQGFSLFDIARDTILSRLQEI